MNNMKPGFTLMELMVAAGICAFLAAALISTMMVVNRQSTLIEEKRIAMDELKDVVERIAATDFANVTTDFPHGVELAKYNNRFLRDEKVFVTYENPLVDELQITVTITWTGGLYNEAGKEEKMFFARAEFQQ